MGEAMLCALSGIVLIVDTGGSRRCCEERVGSLVLE